MKTHPIYYEYPRKRRETKDIPDWMVNIWGEALRKAKTREKRKATKPAKKILVEDEIIEVDAEGNRIKKETIKKGRPKKQVTTKTTTVREKTPEQKLTHNLNDLKKIKALNEEVNALKARITRKDATIKNLKRKIEKLKDIIEHPKNEEKRKNDFYAENPDFLEII